MILQVNKRDFEYKLIEEKAGIIKPKRPVVVGPYVPEEIFIEKAQQTNSEIFSVEADKDTVRNFDNENQKIVEYINCKY